MAFDKRIQIQKLDEETEKYVDFLTPRHAEINRSRSKEYEEGGAERSEQMMTFRVRYSKKLTPIRLNTQIYRISYDGVLYNIIGYDDYKEQHKTVTIEAVSYARNH